MFDSVAGFHHLGPLINSACFCFDAFNDIAWYGLDCVKIQIFLVDKLFDDSK